VTLDTWYWCGLCSFLSCFALWSVNYIASEIEQPFGDDPNDLPMHEMQSYMNRTLLMLLERQAQVIPSFVEAPMRSGRTVSFLKQRATKFSKVTSGGMKRGKTRMTSVWDPSFSAQSCEDEEEEEDGIYDSDLARSGTQSSIMDLHDSSVSSDAKEKHNHVRFSTGSMVPAQATDMAIRPDSKQMGAVSSGSTPIAPDGASLAGLHEINSRLEELHTAIESNLKEFHKCAEDEFGMLSVFNRELAETAQKAGLQRLRCSEDTWIDIDSLEHVPPKNDAGGVGSAKSSHEEERLAHQHFAKYPPHSALTHRALAAQSGHGPDGNGVATTPPQRV